MVITRNRNVLLVALPVFGVAMSLPACAGGAETAPALKDVFAGRFHVGVAVAQRDLEEQDPRVEAFIGKHFDSMTPENLLKWSLVHPEPDRYDFAPADRFVEFGEQHGMFLVGHTLVWHNQTPDWVFEDATGAPLQREALIERMRTHIHTVVGRYQGRIHGWDVVNEAIDDDGSLRDTSWRRIIGDDYLQLAYRFAAEADPGAKLYYNDYNTHLKAKRAGIVRLVNSLKAAGCRVDAIGMQCHWALDYPTLEQAEQTIHDFADCAGKVMVTELDVNVLPRPGQQQGADVTLRAERSSMLDPYRGGLPESIAEAQAERYGDFLRLFLRHSDVIDRVTFWGLDDGRSWHNNWPVRGRTAHSLLFDRSLEPKRAFKAAIDAATEHNN